MIWRARSEVAPEPVKEKAEEPVKLKTKEPVEQEQGDDEDAQDSDFERAKQGLRYLGYTNKIFSGMERDEILSKGLKALKRKEKDDEAHRIAREYRDQQRAPRVATKEEASKEPDPEPVDLSPKLAKLKEKLGLDDEGASTLDEYARLKGESAVKELRKEFNDFKRSQAQSKGSEVEQMLLQAQAEVGKSFPDLMDLDTFAEVVKEADTIAGSAKFKRYRTPQERITASIRQAASNLELEPAEESARETDANAQEREQRRNSRSTMSERSRPMPKSREEADKERFLDVIAKHGL
jgi:hypothetical protein